MSKPILTGLIITFLAAFLNVNAKSGSDELDSLLEAIQSQNDGVGKVDNLLMIAKKYTYIDYDSAMMFAGQALALSDQINYQNGRLEALYRKGYLEKRKGNYNKAFEHFTEFLDLSEKLRDSNNMAAGYSQYGVIFRNKGKLKSAINYHQKSLEIYRRLGDTLGLISNFNSLGILFKEMAEYDSSAFYYMKTIKLSKKAGMEKYLATFFCNLGEVYLLLKDYANARKYLKMGIEYAKKYEYMNTLAVIYTKLGNVANENDKYDSAMYYYELAEPLYRKTGDQRGINDLYINYGYLFLHLKLYDLAYKNFNMALRYYKKENYPRGVIIAWQNMSNMYMKKKEYGKALMMMDSCLHLAESTGLSNLRLDALNSISEIHKEAGNYKEALEYFYLYDALRDSIFNLEKEEKIAELRIKYEREMDRIEMLAMDNEILKKTKQRNVYFFTGLSIIALSLFILFYFRMKARKNRIIAEQRIRQLEEEKKLLAAKYLVEGQEEERKRIAKELHDGLGVLLSTTKMQFTTLKDKSPENKSLIEKATKLLEQASGDVRKISHNMMPGLLTKLGLCEALEDLFEKLDETEGLNASYKITGSTKRITENREIMLYRIIQEMVNNTLKHAGAKNITLEINVFGDHLNIKYTDDGKGFNIDQKLKEKSLGLKSIESRVNFLEGKLNIESAPGKGTRYIILMPR